MTTVDLNCDLGEGFDSDAELLHVVTSANIACGLHAGDPATMLVTAKQAVAGGVAIGAHVGFADRQGFGRRPMAISPEEIWPLVHYQVGGLAAVVASVGGILRYIKPHGALYHRANHDPRIAEIMVAVALSCSPGLRIVGLARSALEREAKRRGCRFSAEGYCDRGYGADGLLLPRHVAGSVISDSRQVVAQALLLVFEGEVACDGGRIHIGRPDSLCVHGDSPGAVDLAREVRRHLEANGIVVQSPI